MPAGSHRESRGVDARGQSDLLRQGGPGFGKPDDKQADDQYQTPYHGRSQHRHQTAQKFQVGRFRQKGFIVDGHQAYHIPDCGKSTAPPR